MKWLLERQTVAKQLWPPNAWRITRAHDTLT